MPDEPDELAELERRREELYRELGQVGDFRRGSLNEVRRKCGKPNCACAAPDHPGHGPQYNLTRTVEGRTRARHLKPGPELEKIRREISAYERFRSLAGQVTEVNEAICDARPAAPPGSAADADPSGTGGEKGAPRGRSRTKGPPRSRRLAAEAARSLGCGDAGMEAAETVIRAGMLKLGLRHARGAAVCRPGAPRPAGAMRPGP